VTREHGGLAAAVTIVACVGVPTSRTFYGDAENARHENAGLEKTRKEKYETPCIK